MSNFCLGTKKVCLILLKLQYGQVKYFLVIPFRCVSISGSTKCCIEFRAIFSCFSTTGHQIAATKRRTATHVKFYNAKRRFCNIKWLAFEGIREKQVVVARLTMCLNKEVVQQVFHNLIAFKHCCLVKSVPSKKRKFLTSRV